MIPATRKRDYSPSYRTNCFNDDFDFFFNNTKSNSPAVNIREDEKNYQIEMALAGLSKEDVKIEIEKNILMISSETKKEESKELEGYNRKEFGFQSFCRNFTIPENADNEKISATFKNGILNIEIPKSKEEVKLNRVVKIS